MLLFSFVIGNQADQYICWYSELGAVITIPKNVEAALELSNG